jgi:flagellar motor switch protein FliN/FliY
VAANDDLLTPEEIEALMQAARSAPPPGAAPPPPGPMSAATAGALEALEELALDPPPPRQPARKPASAELWGGSPDDLLQQAQSQLAAALAPDSSRTKGPPPELGSPQNFAFPDFMREAPEGVPPAFAIGALQDVELELRIELGRTELLIEEVLQLREGTVVPLDKLAGDPVDILVNGRIIARGEVLVLNDNFCVRVAEILTPDV